MNINDLVKLYKAKKAKYGPEAYRCISNVLSEAKEQHREELML